jgi:hypothetical protein
MSTIGVGVDADAGFVESAAIILASASSVFFSSSIVVVGGREWLM